MLFLLKVSEIQCWILFDECFVTRRLFVDSQLFLKWNIVFNILRTVIFDSAVGLFLLA